MNDGSPPTLSQAAHPRLVVRVFPILILLGALFAFEIHSRSIKRVQSKRKTEGHDGVPRRRCRRYTARKARSRSRCRNTATRPTSRTGVDAEPSTHRPSHCCRISFCTRRGIRLRFRAAARDSNRTRANLRGIRTRGCRWMSVEMQVIAVLLSKSHVEVAPNDIGRFTCSHISRNFSCQFFPSLSLEFSEDHYSVLWFC